MSGGMFGAIELLLIFGPVLGFAVWELIRLRRAPHPAGEDNKRHGENREDGPARK